VTSQQPRGRGRTVDCKLCWAPHKVTVDSLLFNGSPQITCAPASVVVADFLAIAVELYVFYFEHFHALVNRLSNRVRGSQPLINADRLARDFLTHDVMFLIIAIPCGLLTRPALSSACQKLGLECIRMFPDVAACSLLGTAQNLVPCYARFFTGFKRMFRIIKCLKLPINEKILRQLKLRPAADIIKWL